MATYFHGVLREIEPDGMQTLYLMNPYIGYSDASPSPANMLLLNSTANPLNQANLSHSPPLNQQHHHLVGVPVASQDSIQGLLPRFHHNLWTPSLSNNSMDLSSQLGLRRPSVVPSARQGLSLSLSPQQPPYASYQPDPGVPNSATDASPSAEDVSAVGNSGVERLIMGSNYLKAAQQLLDEVVNMDKGVKCETGKGSDSRNQKKIDTTDVDAKHGAPELTTAERQELQMKKAKLVSMLDEVQQRYRQYHNQMQIVVSLFHAVAGFGSARTYTALALQTISKQFRRLRDSISGQIRATSKSLGEEEFLGGSRSQGSRLRLVDHHLRQQKALQQLGMIQQSARMPQRGLPERAVSLLRAWLFEHFLHPYPKDCDKHMLAKQTGLTRNQVSNWFINARVRLWKPMVEEMYAEEETKEQEVDNLGGKSSKSDDNGDSTSKSSAGQESGPTDPLPPPITITHSASGFAAKHASNNTDEGLIQPKMKKARSDESLRLNINDISNQEVVISFGNEKQFADGHHGYSLMTDSANHVGGFGSCFDSGQFSSRFSVSGNSSSVSLTLGLPHSEGLSLSGPPPSYISSDGIPFGRRLEMNNENNDYCSSINSNPAVAHPSNAYENMNINQSRKKFAAQLLQDFVA